MTKAEFIKAVAKSADTTEINARKFTEGVLQAITDTLGKKDSIVFPGFGTFQTVEKQEKKGRNPRTGDTITIPAKTAPKFTAGKLLKEAVNKK